MHPVVFFIFSKYVSGPSTAMETRGRSELRQRDTQHPPPAPSSPNTALHACANPAVCRGHSIAYATGGACQEFVTDTMNLFPGTLQPAGRLDTHAEWTWCVWVSRRRDALRAVRQKKKKKVSILSQDYVTLSLSFFASIAPLKDAHHHLMMTIKE